MEKSCKTVEINGEQYIRADVARSLPEGTKTTGLSELVGYRVLLMCANYFYEGVLVHIDETDAILDEAAIIYDTGPWNQIKISGWKNRQLLLGQHGVKLQAVESYCPTPPLVTP